MLWKKMLAHFITGLALVFTVLPAVAADPLDATSDRKTAATTHPNPTASSETLTVVVTLSDTPTPTVTAFDQENIEVTGGAVIVEHSATDTPNAVATGTPRQYVVKITPHPTADGPVVARVVVNVGEHTPQGPMPLIHRSYEDLKDQMQPGDVIAFSGTQPISTAIKFMTGSHVSHVGMIVPADLLEEATPDTAGPMIAEATENGIEIRPLQERVTDETVEKLWWLPLRSDLRRKLDMDTFRNYLRTTHQTAYDYLQVATLGLLLLEPTFDAMAPGVDDQIRQSIHKTLLRDSGSEEAAGLGGLLPDVVPKDIAPPIVSDATRLLLKGNTSGNLSRQLENQRDFENFFCSEFVTGALIAAKVISDINASQVTPVDLCQFHIYDAYIQFKGRTARIRGFNAVNPSRWVE